MANCHLSVHLAGAAMALTSRMLKNGGVAGTIPLLAQRAASEGPRWTRAVGIIPPTPYKVIVRCGLAWENARLGAQGGRVRCLVFLSSLMSGRLLVWWM